jgi:hypothetical protein
MRQMNWLRVLGYSAAVVALFVLGALKTNSRNSAFVTGCLVLGYLNDFVLLRSIISLSRGQKTLNVQAIATMVMLVLGNVVVIHFGYGRVLALTTVGAVVVDAAVLKFR